MSCNKCKTNIENSNGPSGVVRTIYGPTWKQPILIGENGITIVGNPTPLNEKNTIVTKWLGINWIGYPWPKRIRIKRYFPFLYIKQYPGCGCILTLKQIYSIIKPHPSPLL